MQKLSRSLIALGGLAALAACGDDVSITPPPTPPAAVVTEVTVSPATLNLKVGEKATLGVSVATTGPGVATTVTWASSTPAVATVSATGEVTAVAAGNTTVRATSTADGSKSGAAQVTVTAPAVRSVTVSPSVITLQVGSSATAVATVDRDAPLAGTVTWATSAASIATVSTAGVIAAVAPGTAVITATSTADNTKSAALAVNVTAIPANLISLNVVPATVNIGPGGTQQLTPTVNTVGSPAVTYTYSTGNSAVATVSASGLVTGVANGTTAITVTASTSVNSLSTSVTVNVNAASVSIASLTQNNAPVNLAGVAGQIEATLNINSGSQQIDHVDVLIDNVVAASQVFGVNGAPNAPVTLSINTAAFDANYVPKYLNGLRTIQAKIYPVSGANPTASNTQQFTLANADVVYFNASTGTTSGAAGLNHTGNSAVSAAPATWWKGGFTYRAHPVAYSGQIASITYNSSACGAATGTGSPFVATFSCSGVESSQNITNALTVTYNAGYTLTTAPTTFMTALSTGYVPGQPVYSAVSTNEDNVGPSASAVAFSNGLTAVGSDNWAGSPTTWTATWTDAGVGMTSSSASSTAQTDVSNDGGTTWGFANITNPLSLAETLTGAGYTASAAPGTDLLGNTGSRGASSVAFGVDLVVLDAQYADRGTSALATIFPLAQNGTIYTAAAWGALDGVTDVLAVDAIDTRSGLDNPNAQVSSLVRRIPTGNSSCASGASAMATILADNYVQTTTPAQLDCGLAAGSRVGYYTWTASVKDRAQNSKKITDGANVIDSVYIAIDEAAPNITGLGFQTSLYTGGQPATYSISANDDLELKDGQVAMTYTGITPLIVYPYGAASYSSAAFGSPFDATFSNVINGANLTLSYYIVRYDFVTAAAFVPGGAPSGNVSGFTSSGLNTGVTASVRDMADQTASLASVPVLSTQIADRSAAPAYAGAMIHWNGTANSGSSVTVQQVGFTSTTVPYCDRIDIYETTGAAAGADVAANAGPLTYRTTITAAPTITDNGFQRFWTYTKSSISPAIAANNAVAVCIKSGSALVSRTF